MEKKIPTYRIGNDIPLALDISVNGVQATDEHIDITLFDPRGKGIALDWTITDGHAHATFAGAIQRLVGVYVIKVVRNDGQTGMSTSDAYIFRLVAHTWECNAGAPDILPIAGASLADILSVEEIGALHELVNAGLIDIPGRVEGLENRMSDAEARIKAIEDNVCDDAETEAAMDQVFN